jgi:hypothetical protein
MFFQEHDINELLNCQQCKKRFEDPRVLSCGESICSNCLVELIGQQSVNLKGKLKCCYCTKEHVVPEEGFPTSKHLEKLLTKRPNEIYRNEMVKDFKTLLKTIKVEIKNLDDILNGGIEKIKERCSLLKHKIQMKAESRVCQINKMSNEMQQEIDKYEIECIESFEKSAEIKKRVIKATSEGKSFYETSNKYLAQFEIDRQEVMRLIEKSKKTLNNYKTMEMDLQKVIFTTKYLEFEENEKQLDSSSIGWIRQKASFLDSVILDEKQRTDTITLCNFDSSSKWSLIYRASRDGRSAHAFHSNCDNKAKTLTVVKCTEGYIFGAYTEQAWDSNKQLKFDPNAFVFSIENPASKTTMKDCHWLIRDNIKAIYCNTSYGPTFISEDILKPSLHILFDNQESKAYLSSHDDDDDDNDYDANDDKYEDKDKLCYLTSKKNFEFAELEVFEHISIY